MCQKSEYTIFQKKALATSPLIPFLRENLCVRTKFSKNSFKRSYLYHYFAYSVKIGTRAKNRNVPFFRRKSWLHYLMLGLCGKTFVFEQNFQKLFQKSYLHHYLANSVKTGTRAKNRNVPFFQKKVLSTLPHVWLFEKTYVFEQIFKKLFQKKLLIPLFALQRQNGDMCQESEYTTFQRKVLAT